MTRAVRSPTFEELHELLGATLFVGDCGHRWVGSESGSYACPVCGRYEGDHHLVSMEKNAVQLEGWPLWSPASPSTGVS